jgi:hypothetical protein
MKFIALAVISIFSTHASLSQELNFKGPLAYIEVAGAAHGTYSINVEHSIFRKSTWRVNARIGYGYLKAYGDIDHRIPIGVNVSSGKKNSHPEVGLHLTYTRTSHDVADRHVSKSLYFVPTISYRFQKPTSGLFFRIGYAPVLKLKEFTDSSPWVRLGQNYYSFGAALGYYFGRQLKSD